MAGEPIQHAGGLTRRRRFQWRERRRRRRDAGGPRARARPDATQAARAASGCTCSCGERRCSRSSRSSRSGRTASCSTPTTGRTRARAAAERRDPRTPRPTTSSISSTPTSTSPGTDQVPAAPAAAASRRPVAGALRNLAVQAAPARSPTRTCRKRGRTPTARPTSRSSRSSTAERARSRPAGRSRSTWRRSSLKSPSGSVCRTSARSCRPPSRNLKILKSKQLKVVQDAVKALKGLACCSRSWFRCSTRWRSSSPWTPPPHADDGRDRDRVRGRARVCSAARSSTSQVTDSLVKVEANQPCRLRCSRSRPRCSPRSPARS